MVRGVLARPAGDRLSVGGRSVQPSGIRKFFDLINQNPDIISLGVGEPDLLAPMPVRMSAVAALVEGRTGYTSNAGKPELREALAAYMEKRLGLTYEAASEILVTAGVAQGIDLALRAVVNPGDEVLIPEPCFVSYGPCTVLAGGRPVSIPLSGADQFRLTPERLEASITPRTRVLLLSYPNNPTGATLSREDLLRLLPIILRYDLTVISDEVYSELTYEEPHVSLAGLPGMRDRTIMLNGFSKTFAMTGWRLGFVAGPSPIIQAMIRIQQYVMMCAPTVAQIGALRALSMVDEVVQIARDTYLERRDVISAGLGAMGLPHIKPRGAFFAFPSITRTGMSDDTFAERLLQEEKVAVIPGSAFGESGKGFVRCSFAVERSKLEQALERMGTFVKRYGSL